MYLGLERQKRPTYTVKPFEKTKPGDIQIIFLENCAHTLYVQTQAPHLFGAFLDRMKKPFAFVCREPLLQYSRRAAVMRQLYYCSDKNTPNTTTFVAGEPKQKPKP